MDIAYNKRVSAQLSAHTHTHTHTDILAVHICIHGHSKKLVLNTRFSKVQRRSLCQAKLRILSTAVSGVRTSDLIIRAACSQLGRDSDMNLSLTVEGIVLG